MKNNFIILIISLLIIFSFIVVYKYNKQIKEDDTLLNFKEAENFNIRLDKKEFFENFMNESDCSSLTYRNYTKRIDWVCSKDYYILLIRKFIKDISVPIIQCKYTYDELLDKKFAWEIRYNIKEDDTTYTIIQFIDTNKEEILCESKNERKFMQYPA